MHPHKDNFGTVRQMPNQLVLSTAGLEHIKRFEGFRLRAYDDFNPDERLGYGSTVEGTLTIGYGHVSSDIYAGMEITAEKAEALLSEDLKRFEAGIKRRVKVPLSVNEYDALVAFTFNIGLGAFKKSTLLRKLNAFDYDGAAMEFERWVYSKGRKLPGLMARRTAERVLFNGMAAYGMLDLDALAVKAEDLLGIGSNVRPDAVEGAGVMKPKMKSKTMLTGALGLVGSFVGYFAELDRTVQLVLLVMAFGYVVFNRYLEWKAGEH